MRRLTKRIGTDVVDFSDEEVGKFINNHKDNHKAGVKALFKKLAEYEDLEEQGLLLRLPFSVGNTVYTNFRCAGWYMRSNKAPHAVKIVFIGINGEENFFNVVYENGNMWQFNFSDIGKNVFLTRKEAEEKLA